MKFRSVIPKNVDPIKLADEIKRGMSKKFLKRLKMLDIRPPQAPQSQ